jgi:hypothetical protein
MQDVFQMDGTMLSERDKLKRVQKMPASWSAHTFKSDGFSLSGPAALRGCAFQNSRRLSSSVT